MESLSIWSLAGGRFELCCHHGRSSKYTEGVPWHTFNYDVTVSNGVNLCHPVRKRVGPPLGLPYFG